MGIFFERQPLAATVRDEISDAFQAPPPAAPQLQQEVDDAVGRLTATEKKLKIGRLVGSFVLLLLIFLAGIWTAKDPQLKQFSDVLNNSFVTLLGIIIGLVTGENASTG